ncbi:discoidin domain-containing protein [Variovorax sp. NFACC27]|uniref:discoidin domain-containing protein n=1 Tax=unclassified Variovorax TaxID=663243 RepID=UPI0008953F25|nr:F5/8 type C domain-containing protein [Variovorax sp. NFACC28]SEG78211.1 F5/8 type C domain-containing protein [Variovorax sp. NFACC29]SFC95603.1 F5/8 type C domain-containing protein [Variovorax sp. NFACC26]SFG08788.1 F5/8 type C domain-containing protein [Variovorax sp. NFACC27]
MATAFKFYRLKFTKNSSGDLRYYCVAEWAMFEAADASGLDVMRSGTMSANGVYESFVPANANDGNAATYWESDNRVTAGTPSMLSVELPAAVVVRSMRLVSTAQPLEYPRDFELQGSNDGSAWTTIVAFVDFMVSGGPTTKTSAIWTQVRGTSRLEGGVAASRVLIQNWSTGALLASLTPAANGTWSWPAPSLDQVLVTHLGPSGYRPIADGPITPAEV